MWEDDGDENWEADAEKWIVTVYYLKWIKIGPYEKKYYMII